MVMISSKPKTNTDSMLFTYSPHYTTRKHTFIYLLVCLSQNDSELLEGWQADTHLYGPTTSTVVATFIGVQP